MYRLRATCPPDVAAKVVAELEAQSGIGRVAHQRSAETASSWDVVETELPDDQALESVIETISSIQGSDALEVTVTPVEDGERYRFSDGRAVRLEDELGDFGVSARSTTFQRLVRLDYQYGLLMVSAAVVATAGLVGGIPVAVVGAMAFSPDLGRLNAMSFAVIAREAASFLRGAGSLAVGMIVVIASSGVCTLLLKLIDVDEPLAQIPERLVDYVTVLDGVTVTIAIGAGVAAMIVFIADRGRAAVGVGVSITTIPAAAYVGVAFADRAWASAADALTVLVVNIVCVVFAGVATGLVLRRRLHRRASALQGRTAPR